MKLLEYVESEIKWVTHARNNEAEDVKDEVWCKGFCDAMNLVKDKIIKEEFNDRKSITS